MPLARIKPTSTARADHATGAPELETGNKVMTNCPLLPQITRQQNTKILIQMQGVCATSLYIYIYKMKKN